MSVEEISRIIREGLCGVVVKEIKAMISGAESFEKSGKVGDEELRFVGLKEVLLHLLEIGRDDADLRLPDFRSHHADVDVAGHHGDVVIPVQKMIAIFP